MMKKLLMTVLAATMLTACDNSPVFHGLTQQEKENYAQSIMGEYPGRYSIVYTDAQTSQLNRENIDSVTFSVSSLATHTVIFNGFPLRVLARVVEDPELSHALSTLPDMGLTGNYEFKKESENGKVGWYFDMNPVALSLTYGGQQHNIVLHFSSLYTSITLAKGQIQGGTAFEQDRQLSLELTDIYEGDRLLQSFNEAWQEERPVFLAVFRFGL
jgi:hypothetical protein